MNKVAALEYKVAVNNADKEVVLEAVKRRGYALEYASEELKADKEVVLEAAKQGGSSKRLAFALQCASEELKADLEVVLTTLLNVNFSLKSALWTRLWSETTKHLVSWDRQLTLSLFPTVSNSKTIKQLMDEETQCHEAKIKSLSILSRFTNDTQTNEITDFVSGLAAPQSLLGKRDRVCF